MRYHHNPERRTFKGRSYKKGAVRIRELRDRVLRKIFRSYINEGSA